MRCQIGREYKVVQTLLAIRKPSIYTRICRVYVSAFLVLGAEDRFNIFHGAFESQTKGLRTRTTFVSEYMVHNTASGTLLYKLLWKTKLVLYPLALISVT